MGRSWSGRSTPCGPTCGTWAGDRGWTAGIFPSEAASDLSALVAVAEQARQAVMESLQYQTTGRAWPACPVHGSPHGSFNDPGRFPAQRAERAVESAECLRDLGLLEDPQMG
jgi:hypothetical protein